MQSRHDDTATPKAIIDAAYALISGRTAEERDWERWRSLHAPGGAPIRRGVNSFQLWHDGARWWILSVAWDAVEALEAVSR